LPILSFVSSAGANIAFNSSLVGGLSYLQRLVGPLACFTMASHSHFSVVVFATSSIFVKGSWVFTSMAQVIAAS